MKFLGSQAPIILYLRLLCKKGVIGGYERDTLLMIKSYSTAVYCCFEVLEINKSLQDFGITTKWRKEHFLLDQNKTHFRDDQEPDQPLVIHGTLSSVWLKLIPIKISPQ